MGWETPGIKASYTKVMIVKITVAVCEITTQGYSSVLGHTCSVQSTPRLKQGCCK